MENKKIKINDWVKILKPGINGSYMVESIDDNIYTVILKEGNYEHRMQVKLTGLRKL
jgi:hypothetical protein